MRVLLCIGLFLLLAPAAWGGSLVLHPEVVHNGEVAMLRWDGETPSFGVARFNDQVIYLYPDEPGAVALLPVGLELPAGDYPLLCAVVDQWGETTAAELNLRVVRKQRPEEHLSLPERMVSPRDPEDVARIEREHRLLKSLFSKRTGRLWDSFQRPVDDPISSIFGKRRWLNGKPRSPHSGTDFRSPAGTPVRSISRGRVALVDDLFFTGITVVVDHGQGLYSLYAHLSSTAVQQHDLIATGQALGAVGNTGRSTGAHLHLSVKLLGERIDPLALLTLLRHEDS